MNRGDVAWAIGRPTIGGLVRLLAPLRCYGAARVPKEGGVVLALNHFSWLEPPASVACFPSPRYYSGTVAVRQGPGAPGPRPPAADPNLRHVRGAARRVRSRGGSDHARDRARGSRSRALRGGDEAENRRPRPGAARRGDGRAPGERTGRPGGDP